MRILWVGNAPWVGSGYGEQAGLFIPRLQALGHEIAVLTNYGLQGTRMEIGGITCYPSDGQWGNQALKAAADAHNADLVIALCDAWVMDPRRWEGREVAIWAPIDHYPMPGAVQAVLSHAQVRPIAMSQYGQRQMLNAGIDAPYVPHGVNRKRFFPRPEIRDAVRDEMQIPRDAFLIGMVAANKAVAPCRKSFPEAFNAFARFAHKHDDAFMYVHTDARPMHNGLNLDLLANAVGCPTGRLRFPPEDAWRLGMSSADVVAALYQAFDVLLNPSMGEGFGVPLIEAQSCGVPVIASDHSAMTELTHAGWLVAGQPHWNEAAQAFFITPFIDSILASLEEAYTHRDDKALREAAVEFAKGYDADLVTVDHWLPALEALAGPREVPPLAVTNGQDGSVQILRPNRAQRRAAQREKAKT